MILLSCGPFHKRIATFRIAELQIAERAHWPLLCVSMAMANACVLQFAILQFCEWQFFYEIGPCLLIHSSPGYNLMSISITYLPDSGRHTRTQK
jgi:hypothetical protein